ncbi:MAG TPA: MarR family transcriptional regulator [Reyranella sp.]|nr:MarR family transcriptional regulator [Reyranella sp.]
MREPKSVTDLLTYRLLRLSNTLGLYSNRRYREQLRISLPEWRVLSIVALHGTTTARDISRVLATDKAWVGLTVEKLRRRGFLRGVADKEDKRRTLVSLTKAGEEVHDQIMANARRRQKRLLGALPTGSVDTLLACLDALQAEADRMLEELDAP